MRIALAGPGRHLAASLVLLAGLTLGNTCWAEPMIEVTIDFAKVLKLDRAAGTIVVGNPGIADATVEDETTVVLTGKAAGTTNFIVLDEQGDEITNAVLRVSSNVRQLTTIFRGPKRQTYSCSPTCEQVILAGDDPEAFEKAAAQIQSRQQFSAGQ